MAEILLRVADKTNEDKVLDRQCSKAGDVIHVAPDGWGWGSQEYKNPDWRIVKFPGVDPSMFADLLEPDMKVGRDGDVLIRRRRKQIDLRNPKLAKLIRDNAEVIELTAKSAQNEVIALKATKAAVDVVVIG